MSENIKVVPEVLDVLRVQSRIVETKRTELEMLDSVFRRNLEAARLNAGISSAFTLDLQAGVFIVEEPDNG